MAAHHVQELHIKGFRGLGDLRLGEFSRTNILVGGNNAGKTSILEVIELCCRPMDVAGWVAMVRRRGLGSPRQTVAEQVELLFPLQKGGAARLPVEVVYRVTSLPSPVVLRAHYSTRLTLEGGADEGGGTPGAAALDEGSDGSGMEAPLVPVAHLTLRLETQGGSGAPAGLLATSSTRLLPGSELPVGSTVGGGPVAVVTPLTHRAEMFQITALSQLSPSERSAVVELLRQMEPEIEGLEVYDATGKKSALRIWHRRLGPVPPSIFGDGLRRALAMALSLALARGGVLLIDEIENGLHHSALREMYRWLLESARGMDVQLFVTTHSVEALDALLATTDGAGQTSFVRLWRDGSGARQALRLTEAEVRALRFQFGDEVR